MYQGGQPTLDRLAQESKSWRAVDLTITREFENLSDDLSSGQYSKATHRERYIETALGQRFDQTIDRPEGGREKLGEAYCDGEKCANVGFIGGVGSAQEQVIIQRSFLDEAQVGVNLRPVPLRYLYYVGQTPIARALLAAKSLGPVTLLDRPCEQFLLRDYAYGRTPSDLAYTCDRDTGIPLRLVSYNHPTRFDKVAPPGAGRRSRSDRSRDTSSR